MNDQMENKNISAEELSDEVINLVIARLKTIPPRVKVSFGAEGSFSIEDLIQKVQVQDAVGKKMVAMQLSFLRSFAKQTPPEEHVIATHH